MPRVTSLRRNSKFFWLWSIASILLFLILVILILQYKGSLTKIFSAEDKISLFAMVIENYPGNAPVKDIQVTVDGKKVRTTKRGNFVADNLAVGKHVVTIRGKAYEDRVENVNIKKSENKCTIKISLTPIEATNRWMEMKRQNRYADTYSFLHPDDKKWIRKASYIQFKTNVKKLLGVSIKSYNVYPAETLKEWKRDRTKKVYKNVVAIRVSAVLEANQMPPTKQNWMVYAQKVNGCWAFFSTD